MKLFILFVLISAIGFTLGDDSDAEHCPENELYNECGTACPTTCANMNDGPINCIKICKPGCFCKDGLVRNEASGQCVESKNC